VEVAKALGGSFKLVTPAPKPVKEMTQLPRETQKDGDSVTMTQTFYINTDEHEQKAFRAVTRMHLTTFDYSKLNFKVN